MQPEMIHHFQIKSEFSIDIISTSLPEGKSFALFIFFDDISLYDTFIDFKCKIVIEMFYPLSLNQHTLKTEYHIKYNLFGKYTEEDIKNGQLTIFFSRCLTGNSNVCALSMMGKVNEIYREEKYIDKIISQDDITPLIEEALILYFHNI